MTISTRIISIRKAKGITQEELATLSAITLRTIQRIENNKTVARGHTLKAIAKALDLTITDLTESEKAGENPPITYVSGSNNTLQIMNLSTFAYLIVPFGNLIAPMIIWRKQNKDRIVYEIGQKIITYHLVWTIATYAALFILLSMTLISKMYFSFSPGRAILPLFLFMYLINIPIILYASLRLKNGHTNPYPGQKPASDRHNYQMS